MSQEVLRSSLGLAARRRHCQWAFDQVEASMQLVASPTLCPSLWKVLRQSILEATLKKSPIAPNVPLSFIAQLGQRAGRVILKIRTLKRDSLSARPGPWERASVQAQASAVWGHRARVKAA